MNDHRKIAGLIALISGFVVRRDGSIAGSGKKRPTLRV